MKDDLGEFERIYEEHSGFVRQVLFRILGFEDLDDAVQDCFFKIWTARARFRAEARVRTWIYRIAVNHAVDLVRSRALRGTAIETDMDLIEAKVEGDRSLEGVVHEAVRALPPEYRVVIVGAVFQEMELKELAHALEIPIGTVKSRLTRGRALLKQDLKRRGYFRE